MTSSVYLITNTVNDKVYVGKSSNPAKRFKQHMSRHCCNEHLKRAVVKHGKSAFKLDTLESFSNDTAAYEAEAWYVVYLRSLGADLYNLTDGGVGRGEGWHHTESTKARIAAAHMGMKLTEEAKTKLANANRGRKHTEEHKKKISEGGKGRKCSPETLLKYKNRVFSPEHRANLIRANTGRKATAAAKLALSLSHLGNKHTAETRIKMAVSQKARRAREHMS